MVFAWNGYSVIPNPEAFWLPTQHLNHSTCPHLVEQVGLKCVQVVLASRPTEVSVIGYGVFKTLWIVNIARRHVEHSLVIVRSEEHTSELQSRGHLVCRLQLEK